MVITLTNYMVSRKRIFFFIVLASIAVAGVGVYLWSRARMPEVTLVKEDICLLTTVKVGNYEMPAFNTAS